MVYIYPQEEIIRKCCDCSKELDSDYVYIRCVDCRIRDSQRHIKCRDLHRGVLCRDCFHPISMESNGDYLTCTNCRHGRDLRRV